MASARTRIWSISAAALVLGLSACSSGAPSSSEQPADGGVDPIEIVSQPERVGEPISLDLPLDESGAFAFDQWPSACAFADETTLSAIFPQSDEIAQSGTDRSLSILQVGAAGTREVTVPQADCTTKVGFPVDELRASDQSVVFLLTTSVEAAGDAEFVERNATPKSGDEVQVGDATCVVAPSGLRYDCSTPQIAFSVTLDARPYGQYFGESESSYVVDGEEQVYSDDVDAFLTMAQEKILLPVVTANVDRLA
ncbi:hypothetical protein [Leucobacter manosquensis]|uniref:Uncharacterized protein n=1 Tax=Leucobacter manosquensis TaxID=2810611 RepID=A0ABS5M2G9_9MICO|nr:hypothetical protein [Leucobacter manosquensis]MBS3181151.1 hypothetical protein [Leucobacter manosquensis]